MSERRIHIKLSLLMFLEYAIRGVWAVVLAGHMKNMGFSGREISWVYATSSLGAMLSPLIAGWVADRYVSAQQLAAGCHFLGGLALLAAWRQDAFPVFWTLIFLHNLCYAPTLALANSISFHHLRDANAFGAVRVWGTIGWMAVNWALSLYLYGHEQAVLVPHVGDSLLFGAILSLVTAVFCLRLPDTPPVRDTRNPYAFLEALKLVRRRNFALLFGISLVAGAALPFVYNLVFLYLTEPAGGMGLAPSTANLTVTLGQLTELVLLLALFSVLRRIGLRWTLFIGLAALALRFGIFANGRPAWLVIAAQGLHGLDYSFFFVAMMIGVEKLSPRRIRASAQSLLVMTTYGWGMMAGHLVSGSIYDAAGLPGGGHLWSMIFVAPMVLVAPAAVVFLFMFREPGSARTHQPVP